MEDLQRDLEIAVGRCPEQARETLKDIGKHFKKDAKKKAETELKPHVRESGDKKAIKNKWGNKLVDDNIGSAALIYNSARHYHLIENGHNLIKNGKIIGFVPGKHIMEKTRKEYQDIVPKRFEEMVDNILRGSDLD